MIGAGLEGHTMNREWTPRLAGCGLLCLASIALSAQAAPSLRISPLGYYVTQVQAVPDQPRTWDVTSRVGVVNSGDPAIDVVARLMSHSASFVVIDGEVSFGDIPHTRWLRPARSRDTFTLRVTGSGIKNLSELFAFVRDLHESTAWQISCANCGQVNRPPTADAGADLSAYAQQLVTLDGSASSDPDGDTLSFEWTLLQRPAGSLATLSAATGVNPALTPDREGEYLVQLIVRDGQLSSAPDTVTVSTRNSAPVANAGLDQSVYLSQRVLLDGAHSSDVDGDALTYAWQFLQRPAGSGAVLERPDEVNPSFMPDVAGQYVIELIVDDGSVSGPPDTVVISTVNSRPVAVAGPDQSARVGETAQLDGTASSDPDGDALSYRWSLSARPPGSASALQGETSPRPTLPIDRGGTYVAQLIVNDGSADSDADTVSISTQNTAPVAIIDGPAAVHVGARVPLTGARSTDPDGDPLSFNWSLLSFPQDSDAVLGDPFAIGTDFRADRPGTYVAQLIVGDGMVSSAPASLSITAQNEAPVARDDAAATTMGVAVTVNVLANDTDADPQDALRIVSVGAPGHGTSSHAGGIITYTPAAGYVGSDAFVYEITDGAASATATVRITVAGQANRPPVANAGADQTVPGGTSVALSGALSDDPDGDPLTFLWALVSRPTGSSAALQGETSASAGFTADRRGDYQVSLTVDDGHGGTATDTVTITAQNRVPVALDDTATTTAGMSVTIDVLANDSDADGDALNIVSVTQPATGLAEIIGSGVRYTPAGAGTQGFSYTASDGHGGTASAQVTVMIAAALPTFSIDDISISEGDEGDMASGAFLVTLSAPSGTATNVQYATVADTATSPADFVTRSGTLTIPAGETSAEIEAEVVGDGTPEANESFFVRLSGPQNATIEDGEGVASIVDDDDAGPSSADLIDAALAADTIDAETALVYKVYAEFSDARLPAQYRGSGALHWEGQAIREASRIFATLTPSAQAILAPFLDFPEVTLAQAPDRRTIVDTRATRDPVTNVIANPVEFDLVPGQVTLVWSGDSPRAFEFSQRATGFQVEFDARIWPRLTEAFGALQPGNRIFILMADNPGPTFEDVMPGSGCGVARIFLRRFETYTLAHELTHAMLDLNFSIAACDNTEKLWMHEATATWAQHYVYRPANRGHEQDTAPWYLSHPERSINTHDRSSRSPAYGAYLWFLHLAGQGNDASLVRDAWDRGAGVTSLDAMDGALRSAGRGGFERDWPLFAADNWNRSAPHRKYYEWDRMNHKAKVAVEESARLAGNGWETLQLEFDLPILSAKYVRVNFESDPNIRTILFMNNSPDRSDDARVHAIVKVRGQEWKEAEDWSKVEQKGFCRDIGDEDIEEIVFVLTNVGHSLGGPRVQDQGDYSLVYSGLPCDDWTGSTTYRVERRSGEAVEITTAVGTGLRLRVDTEVNRGVWVAIEGTVSYQYDATSPFEDGTCTSHASTTLGANQGAQIVLLPSGSGLDFLGVTRAILPNPPTLHVTTTCSSSSGTFTFQQDQPWFGETWFNSGPDVRSIEVDPDSIAGEYTDTVGGDESRWTWSFTRAP